MKIEIRIPKDLHDTLSGPLSNHKRYISGIVLPNIEDYYNLIKKLNENGKISNPDKTKSFRYFLNALESVNNIPDYLFFDICEGREWDESNKHNLDNFRGKLRTEINLFKKVSEIINAYKHCKTSNKNHKNAKELTSFELGFKNGELAYSLNTVECTELMSECFSTLVEYLNKGDSTMRKKIDGIVL